jgi:hypothetical protein
VEKDSPCIFRCRDAEWFVHAGGVFAGGGFLEKHFAVSPRSGLIGSKE